MTRASPSAAEGMLTEHVYHNSARRPSPVRPSVRDDCPHRGGEAVNHVVGQLNRLRLITERHDGHDRAENLFLGDPCLVVDAREDRRQVKIALLQPIAGLLAAGKHLRAFLPAELDITIDSLQVLGGY